MSGAADRPAALAPDRVARFRSWLSGGAPAAPSVATRALRAAARPARRAVVRLVDPSLQATLDQLRHEAAARQAAPAGTAHAEVEVLRAELAATHAALEALSRRLEAVERAGPGL